MEKIDKSIIYQIPKSEIHIHVEATLQPPLLLTIAERNKIDLSYTGIEDVKQALEFKDLVSFLDTYYMHLGVLQTEDDFSDLAKEYIESVSKQGVKHFELFFDPQAHTRRGVPFETVINGLSAGVETGRNKHGMSGELIMCFLRDLPEDDALTTFDKAMETKANIIGVGLDSAEVGFPPTLFKRVFTKARSEGLHVVAHAGEEAPPDYIWEALKELEVERIDHGVSCVQDEDLVDYLKQNEIPLTTCPLSNVQLKVFDSLDEHNVISLLRKGVKVTVNADGPAYFGGYIGDNYAALAETFEDLTLAELFQLARNSFEASFISKEKCRAYLDELTSFENQIQN